MEIVHEGDQHHLDKSRFQKTIKTTALKVNMRDVAKFTMKMTPFLLNKPGIPNFVKPEGADAGDQRLVLLNPKYDIELNGLNGDLIKWIKEEEKCEIFQYELKITFDSISQDQVLDEILPKECTRALEIENIQSAKILRLTEEQLKYKNLIAEVILEKSKFTKTVYLRRAVAFTDPLSKFFINNVYEHLAGEKNLTLNITEEGCSAEIDLLEYNYDTSLQEERDRVAKQRFNEDDLICDIYGDLFLALRAAAKNCRIFCNVAGNVSAYQTFKKAITANQQENNITLLNMTLESLLTAIFKSSKKTHVLQHIYIGRVLEDLTFLKIFVGLFTVVKYKSGDKEDSLPVLHFYYLIPTDKIVDSLKRLVCKELNTIFGCDASDEANAIIKPEDFVDVHILTVKYLTKRLVAFSLKMPKRMTHHSNALIYELIPNFDGSKKNGLEIDTPPSSAKKKDKNSNAKVPIDELENSEIRRSNRKKMKSKSLDNEEFDFYTQMKQS